MRETLGNAKTAKAPIKCRARTSAPLVAAGEGSNLNRIARVLTPRPAFLCMSAGPDVSDPRSRQVRAGPIS